MHASEPFTVEGAAGQAILGDTHHPAGAVRGVALVAHGFKGYKDYGFIPVLATRLAALGLVAHRFNFSHSGMTGDLETFARPDLFERDCFDHQVTDIRAVVAAIDDGRLPGAGAPRVHLGHSRGGVAVLLEAGRAGGSDPAGIVTMASPCSADPFDAASARRLLEEGFLESPSSRTGQALRVGRVFLQSQRDRPAEHDLLALVRCIRCPLLALHGTKDPTVKPSCAAEIAAAAPFGRSRLIDGADHVFNTPNPAGGGPPSAELSALVAEVDAFVNEALG